MKIAVVGNSTVDITPLLTGCTWSGDINQAARKLQFTFLQDDRDALIPAVEIGCGFTIVGADEDDNVVFQGNVYDLEVDRASSRVKVTAFDNLWILSRSKTTRKFTDALPEDIAREICSLMGVKTGEIIETGQQVSFIANSKTGYQIIQGAYTEAHKKNNEVYQCVMNGGALDIIKKGSLCGVTLNAAANMTGSVYREDITDIINAVQILDEAGNSTEIVSDAESIARYSMVMDVYKTQKDKDDQTEAKALIKPADFEGIVTAAGDYRAKAGYSLIVKDSLFSGQFWIKSDVHNWGDGVHTMKLTLSFENKMSEQATEKAK